VTFTAQIEQFIAKSNARLEAVVKTAAQDTFDEAQVPVAKGGRMRVDTGFLRNSANAAIGSMPVGESVNDQPVVKREEWNITSISSALLQWDLKAPLYFGWTANYAKYRENRDGFMRIAAQNWQKHVNDAVARVKAEIP